MGANNMNIAICDDRKEEREKLSRLLSDFLSKRNICQSFFEFDSGEKLCCADAGVLGSLDLIFLDIYMGGMTGMQTAKKLRDNGVAAALIFLTTSPDFAVESYDVSALSYLTKPVDKNRFGKAMDRFLTVYRPKSIFIGGRLFIEDDIVFAESEGRTVILYFRDGTCAKITAKLDSVQQQLSESNFLRCHQSYVVNMNYITQVKDETFLTTLGLPVMIRKRDFPAMRKTYFQHIAKTGDCN